jgi:hypothetical protein
MTVVLVSYRALHVPCDRSSVIASDINDLTIIEYVNQVLVLIVHNSCMLKFNSLFGRFINDNDDIFDGKVSHSYSFSQ